MAFFGNIGKNIGAFLGTKGSMPKVGVPEIDKDYKAQNKALVEQSQQMRSSLPGRAAAERARLGVGARRQLAEQLSGIRGQASRRGLLYSGLRQAGEAGTRAQSAADLARAQAASNEALEAQTFGAERTAADALAQERAMDIQRQQLMMQQALRNRQMREQAGKGLFGAVGQFQGLGDALGF